MAELYSKTTGIPCNKVELLRKAERTIALERAINYKRGFRRKDDHLPKRFMTEPAFGGPAKGRTINMDKALDRFYEACHFDKEKAIPTIEHFAVLDMESVAKELY